ncbi:MAG TPA: hypothetical protein ENJ95_11860 [Bacteroidetes bacterium]|nr:hypothetical protein [Bacteroidota bacterium]
MADGFHAKLTIIPFEDSETIQIPIPSGPPFVAQFNPESLSLSTEFEYGPEEPAQGDDGDEAKFKNVKQGNFSIDLFLDGTGASGEKREVLAQIEWFKATVGFYGKIHRPRFLLVTWGTFVATCVLESYSINYKLFRPDGTPLRATLSATFREHKPKAVKELLKNLSSPDITHAHQVKEGDHLSLLAYRVYKEPAYYFQIAQANELNTIRKIKTGSTLYLPPVK